MKSKKFLFIYLVLLIGMIFFINIISMGIHEQLKYMDEPYPTYILSRKLDYEQLNGGYKLLLSRYVVGKIYKMIGFLGFMFNLIIFIVCLIIQKIKHKKKRDAIYALNKEYTLDVVSEISKLNVKEIKKIKFELEKKKSKKRN